MIWRHAKREELSYGVSPIYRNRCGTHPVGLITGSSRPCELGGLPGARCPRDSEVRERLSGIHRLTERADPRTPRLTRWVVMPIGRAHVASATGGFEVKREGTIRIGSPTLRIQLLDELDLSHEGASLPPLESGRAASLIAYLLLHREAPQPRQRLAFLLWPDLTESQARTNLRHVLHNLRRAPPEPDRFLDVTPQTRRVSGSPP